MGDIGEKTQFIRESWYPAIWADALEATPQRRKFLNEDIVLYRTDEGAPVALSNVCPHRFAQLHKGRLHGASIACPYHGLRFGPDGQCSHNPHGPAPKSVRLRAYPLHEQHGMIWIWMGDPANADPALLPAIPDREDADLDWVSGYLHVEGNYQLVIDNLLDLTHVEFMHPFLAGETSGNEQRVLGKFFEEGEQVVSRYHHDGVPKTPFVATLWPEAPSQLSMITEMRWNAPANLVQQNWFDSFGTPEAEIKTVRIPFCHLLTPETGTTTHYFWAAGRNLMKNIPELSQGLAAGISATFANEDEPMIADIQAHMGERELMDLKPLLLPIDKSAVLARRRVSSRIAAEAATAGETSTPMRAAG